MRIKKVKVIPTLDALSFPSSPPLPVLLGIPLGPQDLLCHWPLQDVQQTKDGGYMPKKKEKLDRIWRVILKERSNTPPEDISHVPTPPDFLPALRLGGIFLTTDKQPKRAGATS